MENSYSSFSGHENDFRQGELFHGRYQLLAGLKYSAASTIFKAWDQNSSEIVFLQIFSAELSRNVQIMEEIKECCQCWAAVTHPCVAGFRSFEKEFDSGRFFLVTEFIEGQDLRHWSKAKRNASQLTPASFLPLLRQMAEALDHLHSQHLICQTLTPDSVLITAQNEVKLLDPGISALCLKALHGTEGAENIAFRRELYMSPEQWRGRPPKAPSDQYAFAVLICEMLTGTPPFESSDLSLLRQAVLEEKPEPVSALSKRAQKALLTALHKDPARRFSSCSGFIAALSAAGTKSAWLWTLLCLLAAGGLLTGLWFAFCRGDFRFMPALKEKKETGEAVSQQAAVPRNSAERPQASLTVEELKTKEKWRKMELQLQADAERNRILHTDNTLLLSRLKEKMAKIAKERPDRAQTFGFHLDALQAHYASGVKAFQQQELPVARQFLTLAEKEADWIISSNEVRKELQELLKKIAERKAEADRYDSQRMAPIPYRKALEQEKAGLRSCEEGEFVQAGNVLQQAFENYYTACSEAYNLTLEYLKKSADLSIRNRKWQQLKETAQKLRPMDSTKADELVALADQQLLIEKVENLLALARQAKASKQWDKVKEHVLEVLHIDESNKTAKVLLGEVEFEKMPKFALFGQVEGSGVPCGYRCLKGTPRGNTVKKGEEYAFELIFKDQEGSEYLGFLKFVCDWEGTKEFNVPLQRNFFKKLVLPNGATLEMVKIYAGTFQREDGKTVTLTQDYYMGKYEVTQHQYQDIMGSNPSRFQSIEKPVEQVTWHMAKSFCDKLNEHYADLLPRGYKFDLPTEAQWEYACRAGTSTVYSYGNASNSKKMNFNGNFPYGSHKKGIFRQAPQQVGSIGYKNGFGLYDMHGNVAEWCRDNYSSSYPPGTSDPFDNSGGSYRVYRGGSWFSNGNFCRSAARNGWQAENKSNDLGFRLALVPVK